VEKPRSAASADFRGDNRAPFPAPQADYAGHLLVVKAALAVWIFGLGCLWALSVRSVPFADSERVVEAARLAAAGDFSFFSTKLRYFQMFPISSAS
jgi:hypothetical protein